MRPHRNGLGPGVAVPETAAGNRTDVAALVDSDARPASDLTAQKESAPAAQTAQSRDQNEHPNSASDQAVSKAFSTLRAELALRGYGLEHADWGGYRITRWNLQRYEDSLEGVKQFLGRVKR